MFWPIMAIINCLKFISLHFILYYGAHAGYIGF
jgi:hypothetical protein